MLQRGVMPLAVDARRKFRMRGVANESKLL
jgi:hypothetical protein